MERVDGGLNAGEMIFRFEGSQQKMRNLKINKLDTDPDQLQVGNIQLLTFNYGDVRPFYLSDEEREDLKFCAFLGQKKIKKC